ncbi:MAG: prolipoprotein diacylglyceryl transferase [Cyclobacteriaceae bacterium]|nr:prolipoprotein diacylglyceryl transferase [Cyclobacteriaceae bacterium]
MMAYVIWDINPEIFEGVTFFRWYGLCWVLGILAGQRIMVSIYKSEGIPVGEVDRLSIYMMLGALIGARFGHILFYDPIYYLHNPVEILPIKIDPHFQFTGLAGLASHGGIIGALLALYLYNRKAEKNYWWLLDRLMIAGAALGGFIRVGNLLNSEIIGTPSNVPWAFIFTRVDFISRHPSQLYEAIFYFIVTITLYFVWKSRRFSVAHGFIFGLGMTLIFTQRFLIEFLKEKQVPFEETLTLNMGQMLSLPLIVGGVVVMVWSRRDRYH